MRAMLPAVMLPWLAEAPDPTAGWRLWVLAEALGDSGRLLRHGPRQPAAAELLCTVLGTSRLLGDLLARHPELLTAMADQHRLAAVRGPAELVASANAIVARHDDLAAAWDGLRRSAVPRAGPGGRARPHRDLPVERVGAELAALAQACPRWPGRGHAPGRRGPWIFRGPGSSPGPPPVRVAVLGMGSRAGPS